MPGSARTTGLAASFGAAAIAVGALVVSIVETRIMREEQHMSVWPRLISGTSMNDGEFQILVQNKGLGPAVVQNVVVATPAGVHRDWAEAIRALLGRPGPDFSFSTIGNAVLMPGETIRPVRVPAGLAADSLHAASENLRFDVCYCSAYRDCWWLRDDRIGAARSHQRVDATASCAVPEADRFDM